MKLMKKMVIGFSVVAIAMSAHAESPAVPVDTATQNNIGTANTTETYEDSAREASKKTNKGSMLAKAAAVFAFGMAAFHAAKQNYPKAAWYAAGGVAGLLLAKAMDKSSKKNNKIADTFVTGTPTSDPNNPNNPGGTNNPGTGGTDLADNTGDGYDDIDRAIDDLGNHGVTVDKNTGDFTVNGKKYKAEDFSSPASMSAAGMTQAEIDGFQAAMKDVKAAAEAKVGQAADAIAGYEDGSSSGGSSSSVAAVEESYGGAAAKEKYAVNRDPSNVAGLSKEFKGEQIGVAADSLFSMIHRRYNLHEQKGSFLDR